MNKTCPVSEAMIDKWRNAQDGDKIPYSHSIDAAHMLAWLYDQTQERDQDAHDNLIYKSRLLLDRIRGPGIVLTSDAIAAAKHLEQLAYAKHVVVHEPLPDWVVLQLRNAERDGESLGAAATQHVVRMLRERGLL
jgi:hypothetical protein